MRLPCWGILMDVEKYTFIICQIYVGLRVVLDVLLSYKKIKFVTTLA